jgi:NAD(P)H-hydrate epimerase
MKGLVTQCKALNIPLLDALSENLDSQYDVIVDAIFGFSFTGDIREPFATLINVSTRSN